MIWASDVLPRPGGPQSFCRTARTGAGTLRCSAEVRGEKCLADKGRRGARCVMKAIVKIKFWPLIIVGLVWLFGTIVPFVHGIVRLLTEAVTEIVGAVFPGVLNSRVHRGRDVARTAGAGRRLGCREHSPNGLSYCDHNRRWLTDRAILAIGSPSFAAA
jgi:hypothetical protein